MRNSGTAAFLCVCFARNVLDGLENVRFPFWIRSRTVHCAERTPTVNDESPKFLTSAVRKGLSKETRKGTRQARRRKACPIYLTLWQPIMQWRRVTAAASLSLSRGDCARQSRQQQGRLNYLGARKGEDAPDYVLGRTKVDS